VTVSGPVDPATGFVIDLGLLDRLVTAQVVERLDHQHLNAALEDFREGGAIPSSENLLAWILRQLDGQLPAGVRLDRLRLEEDEDLAAEWLGE
jgi:6-pyruvoyltetrahydropterin/6-carboxytetrahydropterin synthase